ncbi:MAG TPA: helix-turn-helix domain-containing protein [Acidimicrobiia bacterium]|nr:helix-turn-helix domain-containing protein [Acidimicrobiia bacterium]
MANEDLPPILDAAQVADLLGMNVQMVRRYAREGRLPAYKLPGGRTFKFFRDDLFEFIRAHPVVPEGDVQPQQFSSAEAETD